MVVRISNLGPNHFDDACAGFNKAPGEQAALAKGVAAIAIAHLLGFFSEIKCFASAARNDEVQGTLVIIIEIVILDGFIDVRHGLFDGLTQLGAALKTEGED